MLRKHPLTLFLLLAFGFSWFFWILFLLLLPTSDGIILSILFIVGGFGPALSAVIVTAIEWGKPGLRDLVHRTLNWRIGLSWLLALILLPLLLSPILIVVLMTGTDLNVLLFYQWYDLVGLFCYILILGGGNEEPGWRGYALPALQKKYNSVVASIILGILWACWHLPLFFIPGSAQSGEFFPLYLLGSILLAILFTWIYNNTQSILAVIVFHTWWNFSRVISVKLIENVTDPAIFLIANIFFFVLFFVIVIILIVCFGYKDLSRKKALCTKYTDLASF